MWGTWSDASEPNIKLSGSWLTVLILKYQSIQFTKETNSEYGKWCGDLVSAGGILSKIAYVG